MTDTAKIEKIYDVERRLFRFTDILTRAIASAPPDQASYISGALSLVSQAAGLLRQSRNSISQPSSADQLREALENIERSVDVLSPLQRTDLPLGELRTMTGELKALAT
jgi:enamine deaminase RidA (YjgF/YER057c/UK114 family)